MIQEPVSIKSAKRVELEAAYLELKDRSKAGGVLQEAS
jgi:hypothetical protein